MSPIPLFQWKKLFLPLALLLGLLQGAATLLRLTSLLHASHTAEPTAAATLVPILLTITLVLFAHRVAIESLIGWAICALIALIGGIGFLWIPVAGWLGSQPMINWGWAVLHHTFTPMVAALLGWGVVNQLSYLHQAARSYFLLALVAALFTQAPKLTLPWLAHLSCPLMLATVMATLFGALFAFKWVQQKVPEERWDRDPYADSAPSPRVLFAAALLAGGAIAAQRVFQPVLARVLLTQTPLLIHGAAVLLFALLGALMAPLILRRAGWSMTAIAAIGLPLLLGCAAALLFIFSGGWTVSLVVLYASALTGINAAVLFPLSQMLFLSVPPQQRFALTIWSLLWIFPLVSQLGDLLGNGVASASWLLIASWLMAGTVVATAYWMGRTPNYRLPIRQ